MERELIGGECAYWGCIPSKTLLRSPDSPSAAERSAGVARPQLGWLELRDYRDYVIILVDSLASHVAGRGADEPAIPVALPVVTTRLGALD